MKTEEIHITMTHRTIRKLKAFLVSVILYFSLRRLESRLNQDSVKTKLNNDDSSLS
jgi:hypothetical protein